jgi:N6-L-threonylcarbamoyladenine synthase
MQQLRRRELFLLRRQMRMLKRQRDMITLGIETSCDDTAIALMRGRNDVLFSVISSQIKSHSVYGGVVPELASRMHQEMIMPLLERALEAI